MSETLIVQAFATGTVIDHIPAKQALRILDVLDILREQQATVGINLTSKRLGRKDLLKIEDIVLSQADIDKLSVFAPEATINIIENFQVAKKIKASLPEVITGVLQCHNSNCITRIEKIASFFYVKKDRQKVNLICKYCEKIQ